LEKGELGTRGIKASLLALTVILAMVSITFSNRNLVVAATNPEIYLDPSDNTFTTAGTRVGDLFNVTVWVKDAPDFAAWQVHIEFDDTVISVTRWFEPTQDPQYVFNGRTTNAFPKPPDPGYVHKPTSLDFIEVAAQLFPPPPAQGQTPGSGSGKLCIVEFNITTSPPTGGELSSPLGIGHYAQGYDTTLLDPDMNEIQDITRTDGSYKFTYTAAIPPYLAVDPVLTRFSPYENVSGKMLNVSVVANQVDPGINLDTVELSLTYNQSILATESSNVTLDNMWNGPNSTTVTDGKVDITVTHPTTTPNGDGVPIGTIKFTVVRQPQATPDTLGSDISSSLEFVHVRFLSGGNEIAADSSKNGTVKIYAYYSSPTPLFFDPAPFNIKIANTTAYTSLDDFFNINVTVGSVFDLYSIKLRIYYDTDVINFTALQSIYINYTLGKGPHMEEGSPFFSDQYSISPAIANDVNWTAGYIDINAIVPPEAETPLSTGSGILFQIYFYGLNDQTLSMNFSEPYGVDTLLVDSLGVTIPVEYRQSGLYAEFAYSPSSTNKPTVLDSVRFVDKSVDYDGYVTAWNWTFSTGFTSKDQNVTYNFAEKGSYKVTLTVVDNNTRTNLITKTVKVFNAPPTVNFTYSPFSPRPNEDIQFGDNSVDPENMNLTSWVWNFGDGTNSSEQNPSHKFEAPGNYTVKLTVADEENLTGSISAGILVAEPAGFELPTWAFIVILIVVIIVAYVIISVIRRRLTASIPT
jgi:PKD repeat protein